MIEFDLSSLLIVFDELDPKLTDEERQIYWFRLTRSDQIAVTLSFSVFDRKASVSLYPKPGTSVGIDVNNCVSIKVLSEAGKSLELLCGSSKPKPTLRIFLSLLGDNILHLEHF